MRTVHVLAPEDLYGFLVRIPIGVEAIAHISITSRVRANIFGHVGVLHLPVIVPAGFQRQLISTPALHHERILPGKEPCITKHLTIRLHQLEDQGV
jgi:hypothetical protein